MAPFLTSKNRFDNNNNSSSLANGDCKRSNGHYNSYPKGRKLIGIDGYWYDITHFIAKHPGGPIIEKYVGQDASAVFRSIWGHENVLKHRKPVGEYRKAIRHPADEEFEKLIEVFRLKGWYETDWVWYSKKITFAMSLIFLAFVLVIACEKWYLQYLGAFFLVGGWHQCGFFMHDFMHFQGFRDIRKDTILGHIFGTIIFGVSSHVWHDEHMIHHSMTNTVDAKNNFIDPQMHEQVWAQNEKIFPFIKTKIQGFLVKIQHITFIPSVMFVGRFAILIDTYSKERRWYVFLAIAIHWMYMTYLLSFLPTWWSVIVFYSIVATFEGLLHFQLVFSHYCKMWFTVEEHLATSWYITQIITNLNISNPWWLDWFHGGLNFHIEHHLYPRLARNHLREAGTYVEAVCKKHGIQYDSFGFFETLCLTLRRLKECSTRFRRRYYMIENV